MLPLRSWWVVLVVVLPTAGVLAGCREEAPPPDVVARVGPAYLTEDDLAEALAPMPPSMDSTLARDQYVEQWVTNQLLAHEARRRGLREVPEVRRQLEANETNVLASALLGAFYEDDRAAVSMADLEAYFERNQDRLRLREPYVRVRFLEVADADSAAAARNALLNALRSTADPSERDSLFVITATRFAADSAASLALARSFIPQGRLLHHNTSAPWGVVAQLGAGEVSQVLPTTNETYFVVQVAERVPAGAVPELSWVQEDVQRQLLIQNRKQLVAREVQRLRNEAEARGELRLPDNE